MTPIQMVAISIAVFFVTVNTCEDVSSCFLKTLFDFSYPA